MLVFVEGGKPKKNPRSKEENQQQTQPTCDDIEIWESNPGYSGGRRALPTLVPKEVLVLSIQLLYECIPSNLSG